MFVTRDMTKRRLFQVLSEHTEVTERIKNKMKGQTNY